MSAKDFSKRSLAFRVKHSTRISKQSRKVFTALLSNQGTLRRVLFHYHNHSSFHRETGKASRTRQISGRTLFRGQVRSEYHEELAQSDSVLPDLERTVDLVICLELKNGLASTMNEITFNRWKTRYVTLGQSTELSPLVQSYVR
jgi:hypothetical protein